MKHKIPDHSFKISMEHSLPKQREILKLPNKVEDKHHKTLIKLQVETKWTS